MIARFIGLMIAFVLLMPIGAAAQNVTAEVGGAGFGVAARTSFGTVSSGVGGGYAGASVAIPDTTWLQPYVAVNGFSDLGVLWQAGANLRLGPERWLARPAARIGAAFSAGGEVTGGIGVHVGRNAGAAFTADWGSVEGIVFSVVHIGAFFSF